MKLNSKILACALLISSLGCTQNAITEESEFTYSKGNIYIGNSKYIESLNDIKDNDILVLDERNSKDPNMKIIDSYKITNKNDMLDILNELLKYEENNPSDWNRSLISMRNEWIYHDLSYFLNYEQESSKDVDLNNADEYKYQKKLIRR